MGIERTEKECGRWKNTGTRCDGGVAEWGDVMGEVIRSAVMTAGGKRIGGESLGMERRLAVPLRKEERW